MEGQLVDYLPCQPEGTAMTEGHLMEQPHLTKGTTITEGHIMDQLGPQPPKRTAIMEVLVADQSLRPPKDTPWPTKGITIMEGRLVDQLPRPMKGTGIMQGHTVVQGTAIVEVLMTGQPPHPPEDIVIRGPLKETAVT